MSQVGSRGDDRVSVANDSRDPEDRGDPEEAEDAPSPHRRRSSSRQEVDARSTPFAPPTNFTAGPSNSHSTRIDSFFRFPNEKSQKDRGKKRTVTPLPLPRASKERSHFLPLYKVNLKEADSSNMYTLRGASFLSAKKNV